MGRVVSELFAGWRFPVLALALLAWQEVLLGLLLVLPPGDRGLAAFAAEFRQWCFGEDPASGSLELGYVVTMLGTPPVLALVLLLVWAEPLRRLGRGQALAVLRWVAFAGVLALLATAGVAGLGVERERGELPFPAESLRTTPPAPAFSLTDQRGETVALEALRGRVVLITAVYARCGLTCPRILGQARAVVAELTEAERADLTVVGITLDPAHDTPAVLAGMARAQRVEAPLFRLATGEAGVVEALLDRLGVTRTRDPATGVIDHANLFLVVDRDGRVAYRLTLGERQQRWLLAALRLLLAERAA